MPTHHHPPKPRDAVFSLLRLSAAQRLIGAVVLLAALWAAILWVTQG